MIKDKGYDIIFEKSYTSYKCELTGISIIKYYYEGDKPEYYLEETKGQNVHQEKINKRIFKMLKRQLKKNN